MHVIKQSCFIPLRAAFAADIGNVFENLDVCVLSKLKSLYFNFRGDVSLLINLFFTSLKFTVDFVGIHYLTLCSGISVQVLRLI